MTACFTCLKRVLQAVNRSGVLFQSVFMRLEHVSLAAVNVEVPYFVMAGMVRIFFKSIELEYSMCITSGAGVVVMYNVA